MGICGDWSRNLYFLKPTYIRGIRPIHLHRGNYREEKRRSVIRTVMWPAHVDSKKLEPDERYPRWREKGNYFGQ